MSQVGAEWEQGQSLVPPNPPQMAQHACVHLQVTGQGPACCNFSEATLGPLELAELIFTVTRHG